MKMGFAERFTAGPGGLESGRRSDSTGVAASRKFPTEAARPKKTAGPSAIGLFGDRR